jgi:integrase
MTGWRVIWVPDGLPRTSSRQPILERWGDLKQREEDVGVRPGDPIFLSPEHRVDWRLSLYAQSRTFRRYTAETRRNYVTDLRLFFTFLTRRSLEWMEATSDDVEDYEDWRRFADENRKPIGGTKWDRELAALNSFYNWATKNHYMEQTPVVTKQITGRDGVVVTVPAARAKDSRQSNVHWLTPRAWRRWIDIGLRGHTAHGDPEPGWVGRLEDRNVAFVRLMVTSGLRRGEGGSLLTLEVPDRGNQTGRYCRGRVASEVTRSKRTRVYYVAAAALAEVEAYCDSSRAAAIRQAQRMRIYERLPHRRIVTDIGDGRAPTLTWVDQEGAVGVAELNRLSVAQRRTLLIEGKHGLEPLWLWLNERGLPFQVHSWDGVFATANKRCRRVLNPQERLGRDPHRAYAPYATPHSTRHSFALYMLLVLNTLMDTRFGLTPEDRRKYRHIYGDPWFMVQNLLGHASRETTVQHYLAPVADLNLRCLLAGATDQTPTDERNIDDMFAQVARESVGIQDFGEAGASGRFE